MTLKFKKLVMATSQLVASSHSLRPWCYHDHRFFQLMPLAAVACERRVLNRRRSLFCLRPSRFGTLTLRDLRSTEADTTDLTVDRKVEQAGQETKSPQLGYFSGTVG